MIRPLVALILAIGLAGAARSAPPGATYEIRPVLTAGRLTALAIELRFDGDASGRTRLDIPDQHDVHPGQPDLASLAISGAAATPVDATHELLRHAPGGPIVVRYRIVSGFNGLPDDQPFRAVLMPDWFAVHGERAFLTPEGRDAAPVTVRFTGLPSGWIVGSDLDGATVGDIGDRYFIGGAGWREIGQPLGGATLRLYCRPELAPKSVEAGADLLARIARAAFDFWGDRPSDLFVPIVPLRSDTGGRGIVHGFVINAEPDDDLGDFAHDFAHEHTHSWVSRQIGGQPVVNSDLEAWLNEGFTELTASRVLLKSGVWRLEDYVGDLNAALLHYGTSPVREAPNARIQQARFTDRDVGRLPYDRGHLLGLMWDREFRAATGGKAGLQDVLQRQRVLARSAGPAPLSADRLFPEAVREATGLDIAPDLARYVDAGALIELPANLLGDCGAFDTVTQPVFDRGFDILATIRNNRRLTGLEADGPAERSGLREGDAIHMDEVPSHDSQTPLTYRVEQPGGSLRTITYKPEGKGTVSFQRFTLNPKLDEPGRRRCGEVLAGAA
jgi:predicted metalloprotease with PDZ domain